MRVCVCVCARMKVCNIFTNVHLSKFYSLALMCAGVCILCSKLRSHVKNVPFQQDLKDINKARFFLLSNSDCNLYNYIHWHGQLREV